MLCSFHSCQLSAFRMNSVILRLLTNVKRQLQAIYSSCRFQKCILAKFETVNWFFHTAFNCELNRYTPNSRQQPPQISFKQNADVHLQSINYCYTSAFFCYVSPCWVVLCKPSALFEMGFSDSPEDLYIFMNALKKQCHTVQQESERRVSDECLPNPMKK